jgi:glucose-1-phosphate cytidylyltransferase
MKVVIFCGGLGMRLREYAENVPKPMVPVGHRPILWHLMKYYAHYGHNDFILCLGYRSDAVKEYFLKYDECVNNDFVLSKGGKQLELYNWDIRDWRITFAETGINSNLGMRLRAVQKYVAGEKMFLANYVDGLTDLHLPDLINFAQGHNKIATFMSVRPALSYHLVSANRDGLVEGISEMSRTELRVNGGFFAFQQGIFDHIQPGEELVHEPFQRLIQKKQLQAYAYDGFFASMDTFKDKQNLDDLFAGGKAPWQVWKTRPNGNHDAQPPDIVKEPTLAAPTVIPVGAGAAD